MTTNIKIIEGGIVAAQGFTTAGVACGIKQDKTRNDIALIHCEVPAIAAGVFTTNVVKASCVLCNQETIKLPTARAIVVNAGNANACNGAQGMADALEMKRLTAKALGVQETEVFCASTGVIGHPLPMKKVAAGIAAAAAHMHGGESDDAVQAIMTTDTRPKKLAVEIMIDGVPVRIGGIAKGSGMIEPNMATMLGFITTDVSIEKSVLQELFVRVIGKTFNAITVDGDTSTNDMCLVLASGLAKNEKIDNVQSDAAHRFEQALHFVCEHLAKAIAADGEGATKLVEIIVKNVQNPMKIAKTIANSPLVKTALYGNDPNWGRIMMAAGRSGVAFDPSKVEVVLAGVKVFDQGMPTAFDPTAVSNGMKRSEVQIIVDCHDAGGETAKVWTCDFSYDYVKINADYHT